MKFLRKLEVCGQVYRVYRGTVAEMADTEGECDFARKRIAVRDDGSGRVNAATFFHELLHAVVHESGARAHLHGITRKGLSLEKAEETLVSILAASLPAALRSAGVLRGRKPKETA